MFQDDTQFPGNGTVHHESSPVEMKLSPSTKYRRPCAKEYKSLTFKEDDIDLLQENNEPSSRSAKLKKLHNLNYRPSNEHLAHTDASQSFNKRDHVRVKVCDVGDRSSKDSKMHQHSSPNSSNEQSLLSLNTPSVEHNQRPRFTKSDLTTSEHAIVFSDSDSGNDDEHNLNMLKGSNPYEFNDRHHTCSVDFNVSSGKNHLKSINGVVHHQNLTSIDDIMPPPPPYGVCKSALDIRTQREFVSS